MKIRKRTWTSSGKTRVAWQVDYVDAQGKRRRTSFQTKAEAEAERRRIEAELYQGTHAPKAKQITVNALLDTFLEALDAGTLVRSNRDLRDQTREEYRRLFDVAVRPRIGHLRLDEVDAPTVASFRDWLLRECDAVGPRNAVITFQRFKVAMNEALARGLVGADTWSAIKISSQAKPRTSEPATDPDAGHDGEDEVPYAIPSDAEMQKLLKTIHAVQQGNWLSIGKADSKLGSAAIERAMQVYGAMIELDARTGLRMSELRGLKIKDIDLDKRYLRVRRSVDQKGRTNPTKSTAGRRNVPLPKSAIELLRHRIADSSPDAYVFQTRGGGPISYPNFWNRGWKRAIDLAELPHYKPHALRHYYASRLIAAGAGALELREILGHASIQTTYDIYGHLLRSDEDERLQRVEEIDRRLALTDGTEDPSSN